MKWSRPFDPDAQAIWVDSLLVGPTGGERSLIFVLDPGRVRAVATSLADLRTRLIDHPVYARLDGLEALQVFMQHHVYAVWDFMCLLKTLQSRLTCISALWCPPADAGAARLINEIVLAEETDSVPGGGFASHFQLYVQAMRQCGADAAPVTRLVELISRGAPWPEALRDARTSPAAAAFVSTTLTACQALSTAELASFFVFGREALIPEMFRRIVEELRTRHPGRLDAMLYYLDRHIDVDGGQHGPAAERLLEIVAGEDPATWRLVRQAGRRALEARLALWNAILAQL
jgi:hypothetical protein